MLLELLLLLVPLELMMNRPVLARKRHIHTNPPSGRISRVKAAYEPKSVTPRDKGERVSRALTVSAGNLFCPGTCVYEEKYIKAP